MTDRAALLREVEQRLGHRDLVWAGIRGSDIEPLRDLPQLRASFALAGDYTGRPDVSSLAYENLTGVRVDPEVWDIDDHLDEGPTGQFRRGLLRALATESVLLPYRASSFLSAIYFARRDRCTTLGLFGAMQSAFEHKPFVESSLADLGVPHIPWQYIADEEQVDAVDLATHGPLILRRSRTSGGEGFVRVEGAHELMRHWPHLDEAFVSVAPYIEGGLPVNVGATVWRAADDDDCVSVHHPSVQLIGVASCSTRPFGYCGNDFGLARALDRSTLIQLETSTKLIGRWLRSYGYAGTFGVDFLVKDGVPLFTEVNPRFQGSTSASCRLAIEQDQACLMLEHAAAWLGVVKPWSPALWERVAATRDLTNLVVHWTGPDEASLNATSLVAGVMTAMREDAVESEVVVARSVRSMPGSLVARFAIDRQLTTTGYDLDSQVDRAIAAWSREASA